MHYLFIAPIKHFRSLPLRHQASLPDKSEKYTFRAVFGMLDVLDILSCVKIGSAKIDGCKQRRMADDGD